jgi:hypothetical protein
MKNIIRLSILGGCIGVFFAPFLARAQWIGPDPNLISHDHSDAPKVSSTFRVEALATLDAIDALDKKAGKVEDSEDARDVLSRTLKGLHPKGEDNLDFLYFLNLYNLASIAYIDSIYYPGEQGAGVSSSTGDSSNSSLRKNGLLALAVNKECSLDLRLRLNGTGNPKCLELSKQLKSVAMRGWIGPGDGIHAGNTLGMIPPGPARVTIEKLLDLTDTLFDKFTATPEVNKDLVNQALDGVQKIARSGFSEIDDNKQNEVVFLLNFFIRGTIALLDAFNYQIDQHMSVNRLYWDDLALSADKACVNDIRQRLLGKSDLSCVRLLRELNGVK